VTVVVPVDLRRRSGLLSLAGATMRGEGMVLAERPELSARQGP